MNRKHAGEKKRTNTKTAKDLLDRQRWPGTEYSRS